MKTLNEAQEYVNEKQEELLSAARQLSKLAHPAEDLRLGPSDMEKAEKQLIRAAIHFAAAEEIQRYEMAHKS
jgi:hypothetical protein